MKTGDRHNKGASLRISYSTLIPANLRGRLREVTHLKAKEPGSGHGTALLCEVCREADTRQPPVVLMILPTSDRLTAYYARFGFVTIQDSPPVMMRDPTNCVRSESPHTMRHGRTNGREVENSR